MTIPTRKEIVIRSILHDLVRNGQAVKAFRGSYDVELLREVGEEFAKRGYFARLTTPSEDSQYLPYLEVRALDKRLGFYTSTEVGED